MVVVSLSNSVRILTALRLKSDLRDVFCIPEVNLSAKASLGS